MAAHHVEAGKAASKLRAELAQAAYELEAREVKRAAVATAEAGLLMHGVVAEVQERKDDHAATLIAVHITVRAKLATLASILK